MPSNEKPRETLQELLRRYVSEDTYSFSGFDRIEVNTVGQEQETPLHMAVTRQAIDDVRLLLAGGANVNAQTNIGSTPLNRAVGAGDIEIVRVLLDAGADQSLASVFGATPLKRAEMK